MQIVSTAAELQIIRENFRENSVKTGFVPTMGALHEGHLSLVRRARGESGKVIVSIFINPAQFNDPQDLANYPRTPEKDLALLKPAGCDVVFMPPPEEMYAPGEHLLDMDFGALEHTMEGQARPGHFRGVATIVHKLLQAVGPDQAFFGEKDYQQLLIIKELVRRMNIPVEITGCPTVRDTDGLALSSRNMRLTTEERKAASHIPRVLFEAAGMAVKKSPGEIRTYVSDSINAVPLLGLEYFEVADAHTLQPVQTWERQSAARGFIAVKSGKIRLIDNVPFTRLP